jgi:putative DNA primase/helicase
MQRYFGYVLTGSVVEQCLILMQGKGRNGKSTLLELLAFILGDYALTLPIETLLQDERRRGSEATPDLADLPGVRLAVATEPGPSAKLDEGRIKKFTGGERLKVRRLMEGFFEFFPHFKMCLAFNEPPQIRGQDDGIWRRLRVVLFEVQVKDVDMQLLDKLKAEAPGVLNWLLDGYCAWREGGLQPPEKVLAATAEYRDDSDRIGQFLRSATEAAPGFTITAKELYAAYEDWCRINAAEAVSGNYFGRQMKAHGFDREKVGVIFYHGVRLNQAWIDEQAAAKARKSKPEEPPAPKGEEEYGSE